MLLIKNAKIYPVTSEVIECGDILIEDGKIAEIGQNIDADVKEIIDATGLVVLPGIIDCHSHIGGMIERDGNYNDDINEMTNPFTPEVEVIYSIDHRDKAFQDAMEHGITSVGITPGSGNIICGKLFAMKTVGKNTFEMTIKNPVGMKVALGGNPKKTYGSKGKAPKTRMGIATMLEDFLNKSKDYYTKLESGKLESESYNEKYESMVPVFKKEIPLKIHCEQFDMITAIEIAEKFELEYSLDHAWGAGNYIDEIAESNAHIVFGPISTARRPGECNPIDIESVVELDKRGVDVSLTTDNPFYATDSLISTAGEAIREGMSVENCLKTITINPARIMKVEDRIGSLEVGKDADIAIFDDMPILKTRAKVKYTIVDGKVVYENV